MRFFSVPLHAANGNPQHVKNHRRRPTEQQDAVTMTSRNVGRDAWVTPAARAARMTAAMARA
jgi:hypothetical protein